MIWIKTREEWRKWCKSEEKPDDMPSNPENIYKNQWISWGDWLGTGSVVVYNRTHWPSDDQSDNSDDQKVPGSFPAIVLI